MKRILSILTIFIFALQVQAQVKVTNLLCENLRDPQGIDEVMPRLSWQIQSEQRNVMQSGYHVIVATTEEKLNRNEGDLWNSGLIQSSASVLVPYVGKKMQSRMQCFWKVKVVTSKGKSEWSEPAMWSVGLLNKADWKATWIGYDKASSWDSLTTWSRLSARYLRKEFSASKTITKATVYISGLGLYDMYLNGKKVDDRVMAPLPTDYRQSVLYNTYDVTNHLQKGSNAIGIVLGNGRFFTMRQNYKPAKINTFGFPKLLFQLEIVYSDGTKKMIVSDNTWKLNVDGPIRTNNEYDGEE